jgi:hypothetical protein
MSKFRKLTRVAQNRLLHRSGKVVQESNLGFLLLLVCNSLEAMMKIPFWPCSLWIPPTYPAGMGREFFDEQGIPTIAAFCPACHGP